MGKFDLNTTTLGDVIDDPEAAAIMEKHAPGSTSNPMIGMARGMTAAQAMNMAAGFVGQENADRIRAEIEAL